MDGWNECVDEQMYGFYGWIFEWIDGWLGWPNEWM
jgi:hypothetical protein